MLKRYAVCLMSVFLLCNHPAYGQKRLPRGVRTAKQIPTKQSPVKKLAAPTIDILLEDALIKKGVPHPAMGRPKVPSVNVESTKRTLAQRIFGRPYVLANFQADAKPKMLSSLSSVLVSRQLHSRVKNTFRQALSAQMENNYAAAMVEVGPSWFAAPPISSFPQELYPDKDFIETPQQLTDYFLSEHNRNLLSAFPQREQWRRRVVSNISNFHRAKKELPPMQQPDMAWLVQQLPRQTNYLLLSEAHDIPQISQQITALLHEMRGRYPKRPIFLFTEFLPAGEIWPMDTENVLLPKYIPIWQAARKENISVIGLEPSFVYENSKTNLWYSSFLHPGGSVSKYQTLWASLEGIRLRNEKWLVILQQYRRKYPQALFIIYAGSAHLLYTEPYSLGHELNGLGTFTVAFFPTYQEIEGTGRKTTITSNFDYATRGEFLDPVLQFEDLSFVDEDLPQLAGFDIRLRIGEEPNEINLRVKRTKYKKR